MPPPHPPTCRSLGHRRAHHRAICELRGRWGGGKRPRLPVPPAPLLRAHLASMELCTSTSLDTQTHTRGETETHTQTQTSARAQVDKVGKIRTMTKVCTDPRGPPTAPTRAAPREPQATNHNDGEREEANEGAREPTRERDTQTQNTGHMHRQREQDDDACTRARHHHRRHQRKKGPLLPRARGPNSWRRRCHAQRWHGARTVDGVTQAKDGE